MIKKCVCCVVLFSGFALLWFWWLDLLFCGDAERKNRGLGMDEEKLDELIKQAVKMHRETYCIKKGFILTTCLKSEECLKCEHFILNGGICDPI